MTLCVCGFVTEYRNVELETQRDLPQSSGHILLSHVLLEFCE